MCFASVFYVLRLPGRFHAALFHNAQRRRVFLKRARGNGFISFAEKRFGGRGKSFRRVAFALMRRVYNVAEFNLTVFVFYLVYKSDQPVLKENALHKPVVRLR